MKRILSLVVIFFLLSNTLVFAATVKKYGFSGEKQGYFDLDIEMYQNEYGLINPQVIYIQRPDGKKYESRDLEELFLQKNILSNCNSNQELIILQIPIEPGTIRIVTGNASVSPWVIKDSISKRA